MIATYTPENDVTEPLSDGSGIKIIFKAGTPIAWATALELGLVTDDPPVVAPIMSAPHADSRKR